MRCSNYLGKFVSEFNWNDVNFISHGLELIDEEKYFLGSKDKISVRTFNRTPWTVLCAVSVALSN